MPWTDKSLEHDIFNGVQIIILPTIFTVIKHDKVSHLVKAVVATCVLTSMGMSPSNKNLLTPKGAPMDLC
jgi:hypothetical protein